jgi:hypothetical protein
MNTTQEEIHPIDKGDIIIHTHNGVCMYVINALNIYYFHKTEKSDYKPWVEGYIDRHGLIKDQHYFNATVGHLFIIPAALIITRAASSKSGHLHIMLISYAGLVPEQPGAKTEAVKGDIKAQDGSNKGAPRGSLSDRLCKIWREVDAMEFRYARDLEEMKDDMLETKVMAHLWQEHVEFIENKDELITITNLCNQTDPEYKPRAKNILKLMRANGQLKLDGYPYESQFGSLFEIHQKKQKNKMYDVIFVRRDNKELVQGMFLKLRELENNNELMTLDPSSPNVPKAILITDSTKGDRE